MTDRARLVLRGALVIDGSRRPARRADVAIEGGRIVEVGPWVDATGRQVDLSGLTLTPGFVDPHTHYDAQLHDEPSLTPSSWHGVTTVVVGNCGYSLAPVPIERAGVIAESLENVEGIPRQLVASALTSEHRSFAGYLDALRAAPKGLNVGCFLGHSTIRWEAMGAAATERPATTDEVAHMQALLRQALDAGAMGVSTSRHTQLGAAGKPVPSRVADDDELLALADVLAAAGTGTYQLVVANDFDVAKLCTLADRARRPLTWSGDFLLPLAGRAEQALAAVDTSTAAPGTTVAPQFASLPIVAEVNLRDPFPMRSAGEAFQQLLRLEAADRRELVAAPEWQRLAEAELPAAWVERIADATIVSGPPPELPAGIELRALAVRVRRSPFQVMIDASLATDLTTRFAFAIANTDDAAIERFLGDDRCLLGLSDAGAHASQHCEAAYPTHLLAHWVRERQALSWEDAVWRLSRHPADLLGLTDRGRVAAGAAADLVAFDADTVAPGTRYRTPWGDTTSERIVVESVGVEHVWVNGVAIRTAGTETGRYPGAVVAPA